MNMCNRRIHKLTLLSLLLYSVSFASFAANDWIYTIKPGDNLWNLSENFLVDMRYWRRLQRLNGISDPNHMPPGSKLRIPLKWTQIKPSDAAVLEFSGDVSVTIAGSANKQPVTPGMLLKTGDEIQTGSESSATLEFDDGSRLILREDSDLKLEKLESYGDEDIFNTQLKLKRGRTDNEVNPYKKPGSRFEIRTPSATAAVRGTVYRVAVPDQTTTTTEVIEGKVDVANDRGKTGVSGGYGTVAKRGEPPTPPVILLAAPNLSKVPDLIERLPLRFKLPEIENARSYRIQITMDPTFQSLDYDGISPTASAKIAELPDGKYLMKVRGIDDKDLEGFDSLHSFILNAKPEAPFPVVPKPEGAVPVGHSDFSWSKSEGISSYHFQLADNTAFDHPVVNTTDNKGSTINITQALTPGKWYWRVAAVDPVEGSGPFGEPSTFRVMKPGPETEAALGDTEIVFQWPAGEETDQYQIQVARDDTFETPVVDERIKESSYSMPLPEEPGKIYMRTKLIEADGFEGSWSTPQSMEIPAERPAWMIGVIPLLIILL